jgi:hypothetical protein
MAHRAGRPRAAGACLQLFATRIHRQKIFKNFERGRGELRIINFVRTVPLHLELPADEVESLRAFAIAHGLTMAELVSRWAQSLKAANPSRLSAIHPDVIAITGLVPREWTDVKIEHQHHLLTKHR